MSISLTGSSSAARKQRQALEESKRLLEGAYNENVAALDPWAQYERESLGNVRGLVNQPFEESYYMKAAGQVKDSPLYQAMRQAGIDATQIGLGAGGGGLYGGNATEAYSDVGQNAFMQTYGANISNYDKYINALQQAATPQTTTNLASMRMQKAGAIGGLGQQQADTYMSAANARQAMLGDIFQGAASMGAAAMGNPMPMMQQQMTPSPGAATPQLNMRGTLPQQSYMIPQKPNLFAPQQGF